jgi:O-antigen ligase
LLACGVNIGLSLLQSTGLELPLTVIKQGGRYPTGALLGNEGYVCLSAALFASGLAAVFLFTTKWSTRIVALALGLIGLGVIIVNHNSTSLLSLAMTILVLSIIRLWPVRVFRIWMFYSILVLILLSPFLLDDRIPDLAQTSAQSEEGVRLTTLERLDRMSTHRLGAWVAAIGMVHEHPWVGFGPGTFASEFVRHRLDAELRWRVRFIQPAGSFFAQAHQDYLQLAAEWGLPALAFLCAAGLVVLMALVRNIILGGKPIREEAVILAILVAGTIEALAWFPFQAPNTAVPLLLAAGRGWRIINTPKPSCT